MSNLSLAPEHYADLQKSGLSDVTIQEANIKSVPPGQINKKLDSGRNGISSAYEIPYDSEHSNFRMYYEVGTEYEKNGDKKPKYLARKDSGNRLYIPSKAKPILNDASIPLDITEGEKKALKGCQEGLSCIAISGLWNWKVKDENKLIPDFDQINLAGRTLTINPDNDWLQPNRKGERKNLKQAVFQLAYLLIDRGAKVCWRELPVTEAQGKTGLDDYLCHHSLDELKQLPVLEIRKFTLEEMIAAATPDDPDGIQEIIKRIANITKESEKSLSVNKLHEKTKISKRAILSDIKKLMQQGTNGDSVKRILCANFPGLIDIVIDDTKDNGSTLFMVKDNTEIHFTPEWEISSGEVYIPPSKSQLPFELPRASKVKEWYQSDNDIQLFTDLIAYFKRFSYLPDKLWVIVVCKVFLSHIQDHDDVHYLPMLLFWAVPERGKSKTGKAVVYVSFRGIHVVELREANLFRYSQNMQATLFFDIMNLWKKAENNNAEDILLLRYEKGAKVSRVLYPEKGAFEDTEHYDVYGPTIMATNEAVHKILDTRCIPITMPNRPGKYEDPKPEKAQELRERLTVWRARVLNEPLPKVNLDSLNGRLWDISKSMLQVCKLVCPEKLDTLINALLEISKQKTEDKKAGIEGQIISDLYELSPKEESVPEWTIWTSKLLDELNENRPEGHKLTPQYLGRKLKAIGITTRKVRGHSEILLNKVEFDTLLIQYGIINPPPSGETLPNATTLSSQNIPSTYTGRELVESQGNATNSLPTQDVENKEVRPLVESGRESPGGKQKTFGDGITNDVINLETEKVEVAE